jgi:hypothetical protein
MKIQYYKKNVYGREHSYIKDEKTAKAFTKLTGKKTLDDRDMETLKDLGFIFEQVLP